MQVKLFAVLGWKTVAQSKKGESMNASADLRALLHSV